MTKEIELNEELDRIESVLNAIHKAQMKILNNFGRLRSQDVKDAFVKTNNALSDEYNALYAMFKRELDRGAAAEACGVRR